MKHLSKSLKESVFSVLPIAAIVLIYAFSLYLEYSQVKEIGEKFTQVFFTDLKAKLISQFVSFLLVFVLSYLSINTVKMSLLKIDSTYSFLKRKYIIYSIISPLSKIKTRVFS